ncbi:MAG: dihydropteroate synthase [Rhodothermales bacterium]
MGILNVTPDSFFDGGKYTTLDAALHQAERMLEEGATVLDIGGESSRPKGTAYGEGAQPVDVEAELRRVLPVVTGCAERFPEAILSIDTYKPQIAQATLEAGAHIINDITGLRIYPQMAEVVARFGAPLIVMHALGQPGTTPHEHSYTDVVAEVKAACVDAIQAAEAAGIRHIVTDPGFGFSKTPAENLRLLRHTDALLELGRPVLVGISRKSTIGTILGQPSALLPKEDRLFGSLGATAIAVLQGATLVRTHDVGPTVQMLKALAATWHA